MFVLAIALSYNNTHKYKKQKKPKRKCRDLFKLLFNRV